MMLGTLRRTAGRLLPCLPFAITDDEQMLMTLTEESTKSAQRSAQHDLEEREHRRELDKYQATLRNTRAAADKAESRRDELECEVITLSKQNKRTEAKRKLIALKSARVRADECNNMHSKVQQQMDTYEQAYANKQIIMQMKSIARTYPVSQKEVEDIALDMEETFNTHQEVNFALARDCAGTDQAELERELDEILASVSMGAEEGSTSPPVPSPVDGKNKGKAAAAAAVVSPPPMAEMEEEWAQQQPVAEY